MFEKHDGCPSKTSYTHALTYFTRTIITVALLLNKRGMKGSLGIVLDKLGMEMNIAFSIF